MNRQIAILFSLFAVLFAVLIVFTSRWTVLEAESLEDEPANRRALIKEQKIPRGVIYARDGRTVLARSNPQGSGQDRIFTRAYPTGPLFSHPVGN
jgi:peptidoglycan glycosyltransferase